MVGLTHCAKQRCRRARNLDRLVEVIKPLGLRVRHVADGAEQRRVADVVREDEGETDEQGQTPGERVVDGRQGFGAEARPTQRDDDVE